MAGFVDRLFARAPWTALAGYVVLVCCLALVSWASLDSLLERYTARDSAQALLDQIEGRGRPGARTPVAQPGMPGSPFLEGQTVTVAGAALQQRIGNAVKSVGGNVLSSQIDLQAWTRRKASSASRRAARSTSRRCSNCSTTWRRACRSFSSTNSRSRRPSRPARTTHACASSSASPGNGRARDECRTHRCNHVGGRLHRCAGVRGARRRGASRFG
jgi:Type II secretion system (T2SS), protein M subtype b